MKNSTRYQQLWKKKLEELPVNLDANKAWSEMEQLLSQQMPLSNPANSSAAGKSLASKTIYSKITTLLVYILPIAVIVSAAAYLLIKNNEAKPKVINIQKTKNKQQDTIQTTSWPVNPPRQDTLVLNQSERDKIVNATAALSVMSNINLVQRSIPETFKNQEPRPISIGFQAKKDLIPGTLVETPKAELANRRKNLREKERTGISDKLPLRTEVSIDTVVGKTNIERRKSKSRKIKPAKEKNEPKRSRFQFGYGLRAGVNVNEDDVYLGAFGALKSNGRYEIEAGIQLNSARTITGKYSHASFVAPDTLPKFTVTNSRSLTVIDIPITLHYQLNKKWKLSAGPLISLPTKSSPALTDTSELKLDTLNAVSEFVKAIQTTTINKVNFGFKTGISYRLNKIDINLHYQWLSPYKLNNNIENKKVRYNVWQVGIAYHIR